MQPWICFHYSKLGTESTTFPEIPQWNLRTTRQRSIYVIIRQDDSSNKIMSNGTVERKHASFILDSGTNITVIPDDELEPKIKG